MTTREKKLGTLLVGALVVAVLATAGIAAAALTAPNNGAGTVNLPVDTSSYHGRFHARFPGIDVWAKHYKFNNVVRVEKGPLGGPVETFDSSLQLQLRGENFSRDIDIPAVSEVRSGPINAGDKVQSFQTDLYRLEATLTGDRDFEYFKIVAGTGNGLASPGKTTLVDQGDGTFSVDSSFDVTYTIEFKGARGGHFAGQAGKFTDKVTMTAY